MMDSKGGSDVYHLLLFVVVSLTCMHINQSISFSVDAAPVVLHGQCIETEKQALLEFKQGLDDNFDLLSSWGGPEDDCCHWHGVGCHNRTGYVIKLHLPPCQQYDFFHYCYSGKKSDSLLKLQYLSHLDLSGWNFFTTIPNYFGSLLNLRYLNLSGVHYPDTTVIPVQISNLSSLHTLDLAYSVGLQSNKLGWLSGAYSLKYLDLSNVNLSRATDWLETVAMLPSLSTLQMSNCYLPPPKLLPHSHVNTSKSLEFLDLSKNAIQDSHFQWLPNITKNLNQFDLSDNELSGSVPNCFWDISSLRYLDLSFNDLEGSIPNQLGNSTSLKYLGLSNNSFEGGIPKSWGRFCNLQTMDLSNNKLSGQLEVALNNFTRGWYPKVKMATLKLDGNHFEGIVPQFRMFPNLRELYLNDNNLTSIAPDFLQAPSSLQKLHLGGNSFDSNSSSVMERIGQLSNLRVLVMSFNPSNNSSVIVQPHLNNLPALQVLSISNVPLNISLDWVPPFQLQYLQMDSCNLGPRFPLWLQTQYNLELLNLTRNGISGDIPGWLSNIFNPSSLKALDLSFNYLSGTLSSFSALNPYRYSFFFEINLRSNNLTGPIPPNFPSGVFIDLSSNFLSGSIYAVCKLSEDAFFLSLANNSLSGELPNCWSRMKLLMYLDLADNNFTGNIPKSMGSMSNLSGLRLRKNKFSGELPSSLRNLTMLQALDVLGNKLSGNIPVWIGESLSSLMVLSLRSNNLHGNVPPNICNLQQIQILDLSLNNLSGGIPLCFDNFTTMSSNRGLSIIERGQANEGRPNFLFDYSGDNVLVDVKGKEVRYSNSFGLIKLIDLSGNKLTGGIPQQVTNLVYLISLNLSRNHLSGAIPSTIGNLTSLDTLDLSRNQLAGEIPSGLSALSFLGALNLSFNNLSGRIPLGTQLQSFDPSVYQGNLGLCGPPLAACSTDGASQKPGGADSQQTSDQDADDELLGLPFYIAAILGFIMGFWGVFGSLVIKRSWRIAYFQWLSSVKDILYVKIVLGMTALKDLCPVSQGAKFGIK